MVGTEHSIVGQVYAAKTDPEAADALIGQYMGFIRSETVKFVHAAPEDGHEDELSIAMLAFYEAVLGYEKSRGAFLPFAARAIRNRLIDHYRTERRHRDVLSLHAPGGGEEDSALMDTLPDARDEIGAYARVCARPCLSPKIYDCFTDSNRKNALGCLLGIIDRINGFFFNSSLKTSLLAIDDKDVVINGCFRKTKVWVESQISMVVIVSTHSILSKKNYEAIVYFLSILYLNVLSLFSNEYINLVKRGA